MSLHQVVVLNTLAFSTIQQIEWDKTQCLVLLADDHINILQAQQLLTIQHQYPRLIIEFQACDHPLRLMYLIGQLSVRFPDAEIWFEPNAFIMKMQWQCEAWHCRQLQTEPSPTTTTQTIDIKTKLLLERYGKATYDPHQQSRPVTMVMNKQVVH